MKYTATPTTWGHPPRADDDLGMRRAIAWYEGIQSYRRRNGHVAA